MTTEVCTACSEPLHEADKFCPRCGTPTSGDGLASGSWDESHDYLLNRLRLKLEHDHKIVLARRLGEGGQAAVFLAHDQKLNRSVAIKVLAPDNGADADALTRFREEGISIAELRHDNIVKIYGVLEVEEFHLFVLEFLDGGSLADRMRPRKPLHLSDVREILLQVAAGLQHAHKRGVLHRDVKPANILFDASEDKAVVSDFGLAKRAGRSGKTRTRTIIGTPPYMSPEQCHGEVATPASDQYGLGVVAWEMLVGRPLFEGSDLEIMKSTTERPTPPIRRFRSDCPADAEAAILRMLDKSPARRWPSVSEAVKHLVAALDRATLTKPRAPWSPRFVPSRRMLLAATGIAAVVVAAITIPSMFSPQRVVEPARIESTVPPTGQSPIEKDKPLYTETGASSFAIRGWAGEVPVGDRRQAYLALRGAPTVTPVALPNDGRWVIDDTTIASVDPASGRVLTRRSGVTRLSLMVADSVWESRRLVVHSSVSSVTITKVSPLLYVGDSDLVYWEAYDEDGQPVSKVEPKFSVSPANVARVELVDGVAKLFAQEAGEATLHLKMDQASDRKPLRVIERGASAPAASATLAASPVELPPSKLTRQNAWNSVRRLITERDIAALRAQYMTVSSSDLIALRELIRALNEARSVQVERCTEQETNVSGQRGVTAYFCEMRRVVTPGDAHITWIQVQIVFDLANGAWSFTGYRVTNAPVY